MQTPQYEFYKSPFDGYPSFDLKTVDWTELKRHASSPGMWLRRMSPRHMPRLLALGLGQLRSLCLRDIDASDLGMLSSFPDLEELQVWQSRKITRLDGIETATGLRWLCLSELGTLESLDPLRALRKLERLLVTGGVWKDQLLNCEFAPIGSLKSLTALCITNVRGPVDLSPLLELDQLTDLALAPAFFPVQEIAKLAARFPFWREQRPWIRALNDDFGACSSCGSSKTAVLLQRKKHIYCSKCDAAILKRTLDSFDHEIEIQQALLRKNRL